MNKKEEKKIINDSLNQAFDQSLIDKINNKLDMISHIKLISSIINIWNKIPTIETILTKLKAHTSKKDIISYKMKAFISFIIGLIYILIMVMLPYHLNQTYEVAYFSSILSVIMTILFLIWLSHELYVDAHNLLTKRVLGIITIIFTFITLILSFINLAPNLNANVKGDNSIEPNTTYLTYSPTCPYCKKSHHNMAKAVSIYDFTHNNSIKIVNYDKDTKLMQQLKPYLQHKGSLISFDKYGKANTPITYTMGDKKGHPLAPSVHNAYWAITQSTK